MARLIELDRPHSSVTFSEIHSHHCRLALLVSSRKKVRLTRRPALSVHSYLYEPFYFLEFSQMNYRVRHMSASRHAQTQISTKSYDPADVTPHTRM